MILMHEIAVDLHGFDESQLGIFDESDELRDVWRTNANGDVRRFISLLSPEQRRRMAAWACSRTRYTLEEIASALEKFTTYIRAVTRELDCDAATTMYPTNVAAGTTAFASALRGNALRESLGTARLRASAEHNLSTMRANAKEEAKRLKKLEKKTAKLYPRLPF
jgi:hypothetical protein